MNTDGNDRDKLVISDEDLDEPTSAEAAPTQQIPTVPAVPVGKKVIKPTALQANDPTPEPTQRSFLQVHGRKLALGAGGVIALAGGFVIAFVVLGLFDSSEAQVREALVESNSEFEAIATDVTEAADNNRPLTTLRAAADEAKTSSDVVTAEADALRSAVDDGRLANPALDLMTAEADFLTELATISNVSDGQLQSGAKDLRKDLESIQEQIDVAKADVDALGLAAGEPLGPVEEQVTATVDAAEGVMVSSHQALAKWQAKVDQIRQQSEGAAQIAETYKGSMSSLIEQYYEQRDATRALMERDRVPFFEASQELRSMASARSGIISQMQALAVPPGAEGAHSTMVSLASRSQALLEQAATTTETDPFPIWTGTPGYQQLSAGSDQITGEFDPARSGVLSAADQAIADARASQELPPKPKL